MLHRLFRRVRPGLFALQMASVGASGLLLATIAFAALTLVGARVEHVGDEGAAALLTATIDHSTDYVDLLIQTTRDPEGAIYLSPAMTVRVYEQIRLQQESARRLVEVSAAPDAERLRALTEAKEIAFRRFSQTGDPADFASIHDIHVELNDLAERLAPEFSSKARAEASETARLAANARIAVVAMVLAILGLLTVTTWLIARRLQGMLAHSEDERRSLSATTASIERRNQQFRALYEVAADSGDEADLDRVAVSAAGSARRLLGCDVAIVWLLHNGSLGVAAVDATAGWHGNDESIEPAAVRRVATRGRGLIAGLGADSDVPDAGIEGLQSGVIVPLVVRFAIVGVIGCWSAAETVFVEDDRRLLEMLAGQVAPSIVAADRYRATEERANTDALTGLHNRHQLTDDILDRFGPAMEAGQPIITAMLDIDHFKDYNDRYGHAAGDAALHLVGRVLQASMRRADRVYRYGGEEFLLVFRFSTLKQAEELAERVRRTVEEVTAQSLDLPGGLTISAGLAGSPEHGAEFPLLTDRADEALYVAKAEGRNRISTWRTPLELRAVA